MGMVMVITTLMLCIIWVGFDVSQIIFDYSRKQKQLDNIISKIKSHISEKNA